MPTYQYECDACGNAFELIQSLSEKKLRKCPKCKKFKLYRLIGTGTGIIFKGSGFYQTDYKSPPPKSTDQKEAAPSKEPVKTEKTTGSSKGAAESVGSVSQ